MRKGRLAAVMKFMLAGRKLFHGRLLPRLSPTPYDMKQATLALFVLLLAALPAAAQVDATASNMYQIALNGIDVTVDADDSDWTDAQFLFFSQDEPNFLQANGQPVFGVPESPADFSGFFAMKADDDNLYFLVRVRDEGRPMIDSPAAPNLAFFYDHLSVYLGLFDVGADGVSPHVEAAGEDTAESSDDDDNFQFIDQDTGETFVATPGRTYRISEESDNSGTTLGPDYQIYTRALDYGGDGNVVTGDQVQTYNGGAVDTTIANTTLSTRFLTDESGVEVGYVLEWQVPLASLAGNLFNPRTRTAFAEAGIEYPLYEPQDGDVIVFDYDVTDQDDEDLNTEVFMRGGNKPALFRDSFNFGLRGQFVDLSQRMDGQAMSLLGKYFIAYDEDADVTIDGSTDDDWDDARWIGFSQDEPNFLQANGQPVFGVPASPADFSGFFSMRADDDNLYFAVRARDEGRPLIDTPATPNLAFFYDHLSTYLGLYNIGLLDGSPHVEAAGEDTAESSDDDDNFQFVNPDTGETFVATPGRTYRISEESDNSGTTLGPDYQIYVRALPYGSTVMGAAVQSYNGGAVDTTVANTTAATQFLTDDDGTEVGYVLEWQVPLASLAGNLFNPRTRTQFFEAGIEYPRYNPTLGDIIPFDYDVTDQDDEDLNTEVFMRGGNKPALFRDSFNFGLRGQFVNGAFIMANPVAVDGEDGPLAGATQIGSARPNPFSGRTRIAFSLGAPADVTLEVYDLLGRRVATLVDGPVEAGEHLATFDATGLPSGVYLSRLVAGGSVQTGRMVHVR